MEQPSISNIGKTNSLLASFGGQHRTVSNAAHKPAIIRIAPTSRAKPVVFGISARVQSQSNHSPVNGQMIDTDSTEEIGVERRRGKVSITLNYERRKLPILDVSLLSRTTIIADSG